MSGATVTDRGDCSSYGSQMPHSCKKDPIIVDIAQDVTQNRSDGCCRGGRLSARAVDYFNSFSSFEFEVRNAGGKENSLGQAPNNVTFMAPGPGYTCSPFMLTDPSVSLDLGGQRQVPVASKFIVRHRSSLITFILSTISLLHMDSKLVYMHFALQKLGSQHVHTPVSWQTSHQYVVFPSQHFTILLSHHAVIALVVDAEKQIKIHSLA
jgi:hypothetical protein